MHRLRYEFTMKQQVQTLTTKTIIPSYTRYPQNCTPDLYGGSVHNQLQFYLITCITMKRKVRCKGWRLTVIACFVGTVEFVYTINDRCEHASLAHVLGAGIKD